MVLRQAEVELICVWCAAAWVIRYGFYRRQVEDVDSRRRELRVQRYRCQECLATFSFPPPGVVRGKRYDALVLGAVLEAALRLGASLRSTWKRLLCGSYSSLRRWVRDFSRHSECVRSEGLVRLGVSEVDCERSPAGVWGCLRLLCGGEPGLVFDVVQGVLLSGDPRLDVFLGVLERR